MNIQIPDQYPYVIIMASILGLHCHIIGFLGQKTRKRVFNKKFMVKNFQEIHEKEIGKNEKLPGQGYPDMGSGFYSQKLSYKDWYDFNNSQRIHQNFADQIGYLLPALLIAGLLYPIFSVGLGLTHFIGRILYASGYSKGPDQRELGAYLSHGSTFFILGTGLLCGIQLINLK
ncbi:hypothetical protein PPERSA_00645 [Pseudocohnilembus persalinus]|uniref:Uncharacterized protein n=1 Tax=Pseudocohnilembus persalinus TaxID=266149 RepID=A0A0V0QTK9_PSEPJ|nr:hypothetical protein PPERSA_00645 [Pseudocohnilembus persalinus]|eukprot:KRX05344.1 hypothetical protein PPERSA_00645 [Pseudocohnilembus persalinus]